LTETTPPNAGRYPVGSGPRFCVLCNPKPAAGWPDFAWVYMSLAARAFPENFSTLLTMLLLIAQVVGLASLLTAVSRKVWWTCWSILSAGQVLPEPRGHRLFTMVFAPYAHYVRIITAIILAGLAAGMVLGLRAGRRHRLLSMPDHGVAPPPAPCS
jgi:hypothetical protein